MSKKAIKIIIDIIIALHKFFFFFDTQSYLVLCSGDVVEFSVIINFHFLTKCGFLKWIYSLKFLSLYENKNVLSLS